MGVRPTVKLTRKQIYDEVWSVAVSGMAQKYTKDAELASEFLDTFSRMVGIDVAEVGEPNGVLANK